MIKKLWNKFGKKTAIAGLSTGLTALSACASSADWEEPATSSTPIAAEAAEFKPQGGMCSQSNPDGTSTFYVSVGYLLPARTDLPDSVKGIYFTGQKSRNLNLAKQAAELNGRALIAMVGDDLSDLVNYANGDNIIDNKESHDAQVAAQLKSYMKHKGSFLDASDVARYDKNGSGDLDTVEEVLTALRQEYGAIGIAFDSDKGVRLVYKNE